MHCVCSHRFLLTNRIGRNGARTRLCFGRTDRDASSSVGRFIGRFHVGELSTRAPSCIAKLTTTLTTVVIWPQAAVSPRWRSILFRGTWLTGLGQRWTTTAWMFPGTWGSFRDGLCLRTKRGVIVPGDFVRPGSWSRGGLGRANTYRFVTEIRFTKLSFQTLEDCCLFASFNWRPEFIHRSIFSNKRAFIIGRDYFRLFFDKIQLDEEAMVLKFDFLIYISFLETMYYCYLSAIWDRSEIRRARDPSMWKE